MRATLLTLGTLVAISFWGAAVYSGGAVASNVPSDGYGVSEATVE
ncbi:MAG: hypothetical protein AAGG69_07320 [Pseudomonadota bacterium]